MTWMQVGISLPPGQRCGVDVQLEAAGDDVGRFANDSRSAANDVAEHSLLYVHAKVNGRNLGLEGRDERRHCCACCPPLNGLQGHSAAAHPPSECSFGGSSGVYTLLWATVPLLILAYLQQHALLKKQTAHRPGGSITPAGGPATECSPAWRL